MNRLVAGRLGALTLKRWGQRELQTTSAMAQMVPIVIDGEGRHERAYDIYSRLLRDRIICVMTPVGLYNTFRAAALSNINNRLR